MRLALWPLALAVGVLVGLALGHRSPLTAPPPPVATAEQEGARAAAHALIDRAVATGHWRENDVRALRPLLAPLCVNVPGTAAPVGINVEGETGRPA